MCESACQERFPDSFMVTIACVHDGKTDFLLTRSLKELSLGSIIRDLCKSLNRRGKPKLVILIINKFCFATLATRIVLQRSQLKKALPELRIHVRFG